MTSVTNATNNLNLLVAAGAPTISYVALNAGLTPDVLTNPTAQALGNAFSTSFNSGFQTTLAGYAADGVMVHYLDGPTVLANVAANPGAFGISTLNCPTAPAPTCFINASGFLFYADGIHPTSDGMRIIAHYVAAQLTAPLMLQATSDVALDTARQFGRTLTTRMDLGRAARRRHCRRPQILHRRRHLQPRRRPQRDATDAFDIDGVGGSVGVEYGFGNGVVGIAANYTQAARPSSRSDAARTESQYAPGWRLCRLRHRAAASSRAISAMAGRS